MAILKPARWITDEEHAARCRTRADPRDLAEFVRRFSVQVDSIVAGRLHGTWRRYHADFVQDAWEHILRKLGQYDVIPGKTFQAWLEVTVAHRVEDHRRRLERHEGERFTFGDESFPSTVPTQDRIATTRAVLDQLDPESRWLVIEYALLGRPMREIAEASGIPEQTLFRRWYNVQSRLRKCC